MILSGKILLNDNLSELLLVLLCSLKNGVSDLDEFLFAKHFSECSHNLLLVRHVSIAPSNRDIDEASLNDL